jgi:protein disulfide-isomerase A6
MLRFALLALGLFASADAGAVSLDAATFDAEVFESGKSAFVKFLAPW